MYRTNLNNKTVAFHLLLGTLFSCSYLNTMTINNTPINKLLKPGQVLSYTPTQKNDNAIKLEIDNGNIQINDSDIDRISNLREIFDDLQNNPENKFSVVTTNTCKMSAGVSMRHHGTKITGREHIILKAKIYLAITHSFLESPKMAFIGNEMTFTNCFFIKPNELCLKAISPTSNLDIIRIAFNKDATHPTTLMGHLNFEKNQTPESLFLTNVQKVEFQFNPQVFK